jgi:predicted small secreted protein
MRPGSLRTCTLFITIGAKPRQAINDTIDKFGWNLCALSAVAAIVGHGLGGKMKKKTLLLWASLLVVLALEGCATVRGMGEDIQNLGRAMKRAVSG